VLFDWEYLQRTPIQKPKVAVFSAMFVPGLPPDPPLWMLVAILIWA
jgi:hypothetical protein